MKLNEKLKYERISHNLSQKSLCDKFGISRTSLSAWENGSVMPSVEHLRLYSELFSLDSNFFKHLDDDIDLGILNDNGLLELKKYYKSIINNEKFLKNT